MDNIFEASSDFDFSQLHLENPTPLQGGSFFTKINHDDKRLPLYVQLPKGKSKNGIVKNTSSKKSFIDLLFPYFESELLEWFENLEIKCRELIFEKKDLWFQTEMDLDDIDNMFISPAKSYKSGKFLVVKAQIPVTKQIKRDYCIIYDESESILEPDSITENTSLIPLIKIEGIKFSSKSFQLEINLPQIMALNMEENIKASCVIRQNKSCDKNTDILENKIKDSESSEEIKENTLEVKDSLENLESLEKSDDLENSESLEKQEVKYENVDTQENLENNEKSDNVVLNITDSEDPNKLQEIDLSINDDGTEISLKKPNEIYYEIYRVAKLKAKNMKQLALEAYLEARNIKTKYMLEEIDNSEEELSESEFEE